MAKPNAAATPARKPVSTFVRIVKQIKKAAIDDKVTVEELDKISGLASSLKGMILSND